MGISYGAISQLFTAQLDPPDLEAISPLSTIDATATTLYPGGILNTGFAVAWAQQRQQEAEPAGPNSGQPWAYQQIQNGDQTCAANQALHGEAADLMRQDPRELPLQRRRSPTRSTRSRSSTRSTCRCSWPASGRTSRPADTAPTWPSTSPAPTASGSRSPTAPTSTRSTRTRSTAGTTSWSCSSPTRRRSQNAGGRSGPPRRSSTSRRWVSRRPTSSRCRPTRSRRSRPTTRRSPAFEELPQVRVLFDNGAGQSPTGTIDGGRPLPGVRAVVLDVPDPGHHGPHLVLRAAAARSRNAAAAPQGHQLVHARTPRRCRSPTTGRNTGTGGLWGNASQWQWNWQQNPSGTAVSYVSAPLTTNTTVDRRRRGAPVGALLDARRRPAGHDQRGATGRQRDVRPERLDPGERAQALDELEQHVQADEHAARADPQHARRPT